MNGSLIFFSATFKKNIANPEKKNIANSEKVDLALAGQILEN